MVDDDKKRLNEAAEVFLNCVKKMKPLGNYYSDRVLFALCAWHGYQLPAVKEQP